MAHDITYNWGEHHLLIDLGHRIEKRVRLLFWAELFITCTMASVFLLMAFGLNRQWIQWTTCIGVSAIYIMAAWRFLSRITYREQIVLDNAHFTIIQSTFFRKQVQHYSWNEMGHLHYIGKDKKTDHPLKGKTIDYWGFEAHEHVIQQIHHEGNLYFKYNGYSVRFGRNIYSWHAEEIVRIMRLYAGDKLHLGTEWIYLMQEHEWDDAQGW